MALPCVMEVNAAWERMFGWSQEEVRRSVLRWGMRTPSEWYRLDSWLAYHVLLNTQVQDPQYKGSDFRTFAIVKTKWGSELSCLVHKITAQKDGFTTSTTMHFEFMGGS